MCNWSVHNIKFFTGMSNKYKHMNDTRKHNEPYTYCHYVQCTHMPVVATKAAWVHFIASKYKFAPLWTSINIYVTHTHTHTKSIDTHCTFAIVGIEKVFARKIWSLLHCLCLSLHREYYVTKTTRMITNIMMLQQCAPERESQIDKHRIYGNNWHSHHKSQC